MNKQEAIDMIETMGPYSWFQDEPLPKTTVINIINQIDEPQKVVIPKFVAEWIEFQRGNTLRDALNVERVPGKINEWLTNPYINQEKFARAWLDGYEVEKEKLYTVEIPDPYSAYKYRYLSRNNSKHICLDASDNDNWKKFKRNQLTESEIKKDFDWAWQFAKEVEEE